MPLSEKEETWSKYRTHHINASFRQSEGAACTTLTFFFFAAILEEIKRSEKRIMRMKGEERGRNNGDTVTNVFIKSVRGSMGT